MWRRLSAWWLRLFSPSGDSFGLPTREESEKALLPPQTNLKPSRKKKRRRRRRGLKIFLISTALLGISCAKLVPVRAPNQKVDRPHVIVDLFNAVDTKSFTKPDFEFVIDADRLLEAAEYIEKIETLAK